MIMYKNKEWMQEQLRTKTAQEIIKEFDIAETTFYRWIKKHNLTIKTHKLYENKEWLENECKIKTAEQIGQENNCDAATIRRWKRKFNITINPVPLYQDKEWLIEHLIIYKSAPKIAEAFGYNAYTVNDWILRHGLREEENHRLYQLNEDYFEIIDTERKAYFLGFLMADGFIDKNQKMFGIVNSPRSI